MSRLVILVTLLLLSGGTYANGESPWGYSKDKGPERWGELDPAFTTCTAGKNQSPINLHSFIKSDLKPIEIHYQVGGNEILHNGHTVQINYAPDSKISIEGHDYALLQYHFHAPSENLINGKSYPMEVHLVHADKSGNLAVIAVMFAIGETNESLAQTWPHMPETAGDKHPLSNITAESLLPAKRDYYLYNGSLTTPPCSEGVRWLVMKEPVTASKAQIEKFALTIRHPNNRPVQAVNARPVLH